LVVCAFALVVVAPPSPTASAHNTLVSSEPADGATVATAPTQIVWVFDKTVPLETMTVTLIDATGVRTVLSGSAHGPTGDAEVVTPLPSIGPGQVSVRWRLVGPDGHAITGRVDFSVSPPPDVAADTTTPGAATPPTSTITVEAARPDQDDGTYSTPSFVRWGLRYVSYLAIMAVVGILLTAAFVWPGAGDHTVLRRILSRSLVATAGLALLQLLVLASDISGSRPWAAFGSIDTATTTDAGMALAIRIALATTMWLVLFRARIVHSDIRWTAVSLTGVGLLATWAFSGHSRSMRWPAIGVATDVVHHAAAATWLAGLAIVGWVVIPAASAEVLVPTVRRFSRVAAISVATLVVTGLVQTARLVGSPTDLLDAHHGRLLFAKVVVLAAMLGVANANRRRLDTRLDDPAGVARRAGALRRAVVAEFAIGLVIIGITASMVVSPPSLTPG
jgi:copper transport protein